MAKLTIYYLSYLYFPAMALLVWIVWKRRGLLRAFALAAALIICVPAYARFVEPRILNVVRTGITLPDIEVSSVRLLVFSDTHIGLFGNAMPIRRIVNRAKSLDFDAALIPGDLVYFLDVEKIRDTFSPLTELGVPVYIVLGNHDVGRPGPDIGKELIAVLSGMPNVQVVHNRIADLTVRDQHIWIMGTSDLWQKQYAFPDIDKPARTPLLILTHNPDMALNVPPTINYDLMIAGHTHGGQIRIPGLYQRAIPTRYPFDKGMHSVPVNGTDKQVFVTPGTGMVGLPMRFLMPPQLDLLTITTKDHRAESTAH